MVAERVDGSADHAIRLAIRTWRRFQNTRDQTTGGNVDWDDLRGAAYLGAAKALAQYDPARGTKFASYAIALIRGEILEEMRRQDHLFRKDRRDLRAMEAEARELEAAGRPVPNCLRAPATWERPSSWEEVIHWEDDTSGNSALFRGDTLAAPDDTAGEAERAVWHERLWESVEWLPAAEREVVLRYYRDGWTCREIARHIDRSESRVHQLHASGMARLRQWWAGEEG